MRTQPSPTTRHWGLGMAENTAPHEPPEVVREEQKDTIIRQLQADLNTERQKLDRLRSELTDRYSTTILDGRDPDGREWDVVDIVLVILEGERQKREEAERELSKAQEVGARLVDGGAASLFRDLAKAEKEQRAGAERAEAAIREAEAMALALQRKIDVATDVLAAHVTEVDAIFGDAPLPGWASAQKEDAQALLTILATPIDMDDPMGSVAHL